MQRFQEQIRALTRRKVPIRLRELIARIHPVIRGWGHVDRQADVRRLFHRLDRGIEHRLDACLAQRWRHPMWRRYPTRRLRAEFGLVRLTHLLPVSCPDDSGEEQRRKAACGKTARAV